MSGTAEIVGNAAYEHGGGAYFTNHNVGDKENGKYIHPLLEMSGGARIDTQNTVYFENVIKNDDNVQVPVKVNGNLNSSGTVAIFEFSQEFWGEDESVSVPENHATAQKDRKIVEFGVDEGNKPLDIQENKFALDHESGI